MTFITNLIERAADWATQYSPRYASVMRSLHLVADEYEALEEEIQDLWEKLGKQAGDHQREIERVKKDASVAARASVNKELEALRRRAEMLEKMRSQMLEPSEREMLLRVYALVGELVHQIKFPIQPQLNVSASVHTRIDRPTMIEATAWGRANTIVNEGMTNGLTALLDEEAYRTNPDVWEEFKRMFIDQYVCAVMADADREIRVTLEKAFFKHKTTHKQEITHDPIRVRYRD